MIAYVRGELTDILDDSVILDVQGIGYKIICPNPYVFQSKLNERIFIHTYHHVRDDSQTLYGFRKEEEKLLFEKLISVSGIGPRSGMAIQGSVNVNDFALAIEREDEKYLMSFPGIGKKTSRQIILDLKGKLTELMTSEVVDGIESTPNGQDQDLIQETTEVLKSLGYSDREVQAIIPKLQAMDVKNTDEMVRKSLALLMKN